jgi:hypothetical protein
MKSIPYKWVLLKPISYRVVRPEIQKLYPHWGTIRNKLRTQIESKISQNLSSEQKSEIDQIKATVEAKVDEAMYNIATAQTMMQSIRSSNQAKRSSNQEKRREDVRFVIATTLFIISATNQNPAPKP